MLLRLAKKMFLHESFVIAASFHCSLSHSGPVVSSCLAAKDSAFGAGLHCANVIKEKYQQEDDVSPNVRHTLDPFDQLRNGVKACGLLSFFFFFGSA